MTPYYERGGITMLLYWAVCGKLSVWIWNIAANRPVNDSAEHKLASAARIFPCARLGHRRATSNHLSTSPSAVGGARHTMLGRAIR